jgi:hypothetical protein
MDGRSWEDLLATALAVIADIEARGAGALDLVLGGGTVLMMRMRHRLSKDIDIFLHDAQWLSRLTPRLNDRVAALVRDYSEQANSIKLVLSHGDIDFVVAGRVTGVAPSETLDFRGRMIALETTEEILAKKLFHRASFLKPRDVFDLVVASKLLPNAAGVAVEAARSRRDLQLARLRELARAPEADLSSGILPLSDFGGLVPTMIESAIALVDRKAEASSP